MKAILYTTELEAQNDLELCNAIKDPSPTFVGEGPFAEFVPRPYTEVRKHPEREEWALMANAKVESQTGKTAVELSGDWFSSTPQNVTGNE